MGKLSDIAHEGTIPPSHHLTIEVVPKPLWYINLRTAMGKAWDTLRKQVYLQYGNQCGVCGAAGRLECHERWDYDDSNHVQSLRGFIALCPMCHRCKHMGLAHIHAREGKLDINTVIEHYMRVNNCTRAEYERDYRSAMIEWNGRNHYSWTCDLGDYASLLPASDTMFTNGKAYGLATKGEGG